MHHAFIHIGIPAAFETLVRTHMPLHEMEVIRESYERFSIDDARLLRERAASTSFHEGRVFMLRIEQASVEAQNALLKLFEEPSKGVQFFLSIPRYDAFIDTLHSRLMPILADAVSVSEDGVAGEFLSKSISAQLDEVAKRAKDKDTAWVETVLAGLEETLSQEKRYAALREVLFVRKYIHARGASLKMLLEHLVLSLHEST